MKKFWVISSSLLLVAGCANHRESMGSSETVSYSDNSSYVGRTDAGVPTGRGAGATAITGAQPGGYSPKSTEVTASSPSTTTTVVSPGDAFDSNASTTKGAGARTLSGNDASAGVGTTAVGGSEGFGASTSTTPGTVGSGSEASEATTKGAGARALSGNDANADTTSSVTAATESSSTTTGATIGNLSRQDSAFVREAAQSGLAEVQMGKLVQQNAQSQQLKDFGQRLVSDHTQANNELMQIAQQKGITAPTTISAHDQHMMSKLSGLNGAEFDRMCQQDAVAAHEKAVKLFQSEAQSGQDPELKAFAQKTLPTLQEHLRMARQISGSGNSSTTSTDRSLSQ